MSTSNSLLVITCSESIPQLDPACHFNLTTNPTCVIKTPGGRTGGITSAVQANGIGLIIIVQHTGCPWSPGTVHDNIRTDIQALREALRASPSVRNTIPIVGYLLDTTTGTLQEVNVPQMGADVEVRQRVLNQMQDFGPFWS